MTTIGLSMVDAGLQLSQMGTLTDPFAVPNHEAFYLTLQAWAVDPRTGVRSVPLATHTFSVMPQQMQLLKTYLSRVVLTPGGVYVDEFIMPDTAVPVPYSVSFSGNFGQRARVFRTDNFVRVDGGLQQLVNSLLPADQSNPLLRDNENFGVDLVTGYGQTQFLNRLCDLSHMSLTRGGLRSYLRTAMGARGTVSADALPHTYVRLEELTQAVDDVPIEVVLYNWTFHQFVVVLINSVNFYRNYNLNCWAYSLNMTALRSALSTDPSQQQSQAADMMRNFAQGVALTLANTALSTGLDLINIPRTGVR